MSTQETHLGKIRPISRIEVLAILKKNVDDLDTMNQDDLYWELSEHNIIKVHKRFYMYSDNYEYENNDVEYISPKKSATNDERDYVVSFYNGGTCLEETLEKLIEEQDF